MKGCEECGFIIKGKLAWFKCKKYHPRCLVKVKYRIKNKRQEEALKQRWVKYHKKNGSELLRNKIGLSHSQDETK